MREPLRRILDQRVGQTLGDVGGEEAGVGVGELVDLRMQRGVDVRMAVAEARDRGTARGVDVGAAIRIEQLNALAADGDRKIRPDLPRKNTCHVLFFLMI